MSAAPAAPAAAESSSAGLSGLRRDASSYGALSNLSPWRCSQRRRRRRRQRSPESPARGLPAALGDPPCRQQHAMRVALEKGQLCGSSCWALTLAYLPHPALALLNPALASGCLH